MLSRRSPLRLGVTARRFATERALRGCLRQKRTLLGGWRQKRALLGGLRQKRTLLGGLRQKRALRVSSIFTFFAANC